MNQRKKIIEKDIEGRITILDWGKFWGNVSRIYYTKIENGKSNEAIIFFDKIKNFYTTMNQQKYKKNRKEN